MGIGPFSDCSHKSNFVSLLAVHAALEIEKFISDRVSFLGKIGIRIQPFFARDANTCLNFETFGATT